MSILITGRTLTLDELVRVARDGEAVRLDPVAREEMGRTRAVVEDVLASGTPAYGVTTAVGVLKRVPLEGPDADAYAQRMIRHHRVAQGPLAPADVVRATLLLQLNAFASGLPGVRPILAERLVEILALPEPPPVRVLGSVGQADLAPLADLSGAVFARRRAGRGRGSRAHHRQPVLDRVGRAGAGRPRPPARCARRGGCAEPRGSRREPVGAASRGRGRPSAPRPGGQPRDAAPAARRERPLGAGCVAQPAGPAHVPQHRPPPRRGP